MVQTDNSSLSMNNLKIKIYAAPQSFYRNWMENEEQKEMRTRRQNLK